MLKKSIKKEPIVKKSDLDDKLNICYDIYQYSLSKKKDNINQFIIASYNYYKSIYLCEKKYKKKYSNSYVLPIISSRYVCLIESIHLKLLAKTQNKNKVGFVNFYNYFADKKCECDQLNLLKTDSLE